MTGRSRSTVYTSARSATRDALRLPTLKSLSPVLLVDAVEPCIRFWVDRFGLTAENEVPGGDGLLVFASVKKDGIEIMYQTRASVLAERPEAAEDVKGDSVALFFAVADLNEVEAQLSGLPVIKPRHKTFYGSEEIYVREPGGHTIGFAQFG